MPNFPYDQMMTRRALDPNDRLAINAVLVSARQAIDIICDRWSLTLLLAFMQGDKRFGDLLARTGMAGRLLTSRLQVFQENGVLVRMPYSMHPPRFEYRLTNMGADAGNILLHMARWESVWMDQSLSSARFSHISCGSPLAALVLCRTCGAATDARQIDTRVSRAQIQKAPVKLAKHRRSIVHSAVGKPQPLGTTLDIFGDKWGIEVLICAFFRVHRFGDFRDCIGISANILSDRLARLVEAGLLTRDNKQSPDAGYWLTPMGIDVYPVMVAVHEWADTWVRARYNSPVKLIHRSCGKPFLPVLGCTNCAEPVSAGNASLSAASTP